MLYAQPNPLKPVGEILGCTHAGGLYHFTQEPFLHEGADLIRQQFGFQVIKLWFTFQYASVYAPGHAWGKVDSLLDLALSPYYRDVFAMPFHTFLLETTEIRRVEFHEGVSAEQYRYLRDDICSVAKHLLTAYKGSGKTFILQNWESDNFLGRDAAPKAVQGLIDWLNARQEGIEMARDEVGMDGVAVLGCAEVNKLSSCWSGPRAVDSVIPHTHCDLYSYSDWETYADRRMLLENLDYYASKAPASRLCGPKNILLGEYGTPERLFGGSENQLARDRILTETALEWGVRYLLYWQLFCNEADGAYTGRPQAENLHGYWLVRPDGTQTPTAGYLRELARRPYGEALAEIARCKPGVPRGEPLRGEDDFRDFERMSDYSQRVWFCAPDRVPEHPAQRVNVLTRRYREAFGEDEWVEYRLEQAENIRLCVVTQAPDPAEVVRAVCALEGRAYRPLALRTLDVRATETEGKAAFRYILEADPPRDAVRIRITLAGARNEEIFDPKIVSVTVR